MTNPLQVVYGVFGLDGGIPSVLTLEAIDWLVPHQHGKSMNLSHPRDYS